MRFLSSIAALLLLSAPALGQSVPISGLPAATLPLGGTEVVPLVQSGVTKNAPASAFGTTNASNLSSGTVAAARGGAGTINGALKGNGSGVVSQAACADLTNASPSCATDATNANNLTSGTVAPARLPLATNGAFGAVRPDGSTITISGGVITAVTGGGGTVSTTGSPASGNLTVFSGVATITNGNISGDCVTTGALVINCTKTGGVSFAPSATTDTTNASNIGSGTLGAARLPLATTGAFGAVKPDGSTITISAGVISSTGGAGVSLTTASSNLAFSPSTITATGTINTAYLVRSVSITTDSINCSTDGGKLVIYTNSGTKAVTVPQATGSCGIGASFDVQNPGAGTATFTPGGGSTVNGGSTLPVAQNRGCSWVSDGVNWQVAQCTALLP